MQYDIVIGLEVHVQIRTDMKMFCRCANRFGAAPNTLVCPICLGYPGVLPVPNEQAIRRTLLAGMMCNCELAAWSKFDRKSYFYPDMPKNYQLSQYDLPLCGRGHLRIEGKSLIGDVGPKDVGITRIHLEEDTGKLTHFAQSSGVDFNRAGMPLMEIVSEPDISSADEAYAYLVALRQVMQYADISDCDMEKGQMRCDVNISLKLPGATAFNKKTEVKNLNSFKAVHRAIEYEIERQAEILEEGGQFIQATRGWNDVLGETYVQRIKEDAEDYRYFPCPDLMPMRIDDELLDELRCTMAETPARRRERFARDLELPAYDAHVLTLEKATADYFEACVAAGAPAKQASNWIMGEILRHLSETDTPMTGYPVRPEELAKLIGLIEKGTINQGQGRKILAQMVAEGGEPEAIAREKGWVQESNEGVIADFVRQAIAANPGPAQEVREGNAKALNFLMGQVMRLSRGKANPQVVMQLLENELTG